MPRAWNFEIELRISALLSAASRTQPINLKRVIAAE